jgi:predicted TIM-barrel enzyme
LMDRFLTEVKQTGFAGVQNFPTVGLMDGTFRANLEETNMGYPREVEMIRLARSMDLLTTPYVFSTEDAVRMTEAGADILVAHMGLTTAGSIGAHTAKTLQQCVPLIDAIAATAKGIREDVIVLCHGGPIAEPADAAFILQHCGTVDGFYGASSMERLPTERAIREQTERFMQIRKT